MTRRHGIVSIGLSAAIAVLVLWHLVPRDRPVPPADPMQSPPPADAAPTPPPPVALATVTLPPPPLPPASREPEPVTAVPAEAAPRPVIPPRAVAPLKPHTEPAETATATPTPAPDPRPVRAPLKPAAEKPTVSPASPPVAVAPRKVAPLRPVPKRPSVAQDIAARDIAARDEGMPAEPAATREMSVPEPPSSPAEPVSAPVGAEDAAPVIAVGRPLLRLLEHGDGPDIDIAWPAGVGEREALFRAFERCYGMLVTLIASDGRLFSDLSDDAPWRINLDRYSGFVRHSGGLATPGEGDWSRRIVRRHPQSAGATIVRVFPRAMDALLMGGLRQLIGPAYRQTKTIRAHYRRDGSNVFITDIVADGAPVAGRIALGAAADRGCRAAAAIGRAAT